MLHPRLFSSTRGGGGIGVVAAAAAAASAAGHRIKHIVMFSFQEGTSKKDIAKIQAGLLDLPNQIPCIRSYELGCDLGLTSGQKQPPAGKNRVLSWTASFDSVQEYQTYDAHEAHQAFLGQLKPLVLPGSRSAIQYEIKEG